MQIRLFSSISSLIFLFGVSITCADNLPLQKTSMESAGFSAERLQQLDRSMHALVDDGKLSGIVTCLTRHGRIVHQSVYGKRDMESSSPMKMDTIFRLASMTKPVTGVAMMILYEEGKWHPDDPLAMHFPEFKDLMVFAGADTYGNDILENHPTGMKYARLLEGCKRERGFILFDGSDRWGKNTGIFGVCFGACSNASQASRHLRDSVYEHC